MRDSYCIRTQARWKADVYSPLYRLARGLRTPGAETISAGHSQLAAEHFGEVVVARLRYAARTALHFRLLGWRLLRLKRK